MGELTHTHVTHHRIHAASHGRIHTHSSHRVHTHTHHVGRAAHIGSATTATHVWTTTHTTAHHITAAVIEASAAAAEASSAAHVVHAEVHVRGWVVEASTAHGAAGTLETGVHAAGEIAIVIAHTATVEAPSSAPEAATSVAAAHIVHTVAHGLGSRLVEWSVVAVIFTSGCVLGKGAEWILVWVGVIGAVFATRLASTGVMLDQVLNCGRGL